MGDETVDFAVVMLRCRIVWVAHSMLCAMRVGADHVAARELGFQHLGSHQAMPQQSTAEETLKGTNVMEVKASDTFRQVPMSLAIGCTVEGYVAY